VARAAHELSSDIRQSAVRFVREGTLRQDCIVDGEVSDSRVYGLLERVKSLRLGPR